MSSSAQRPLGNQNCSADGTHSAPALTITAAPILRATVGKVPDVLGMPRRRIIGLLCIARPKNRAHAVVPPRLDELHAVVLTDAEYL